MICLIYVSTAARELTVETLDEILLASRRNNARDDITGMLIYADRNILQVLEGEPDKVDALYARLLKDDRHRDAAVILRRNIEARGFPDWSMGFRRLDNPSTPEIDAALVDLGVPIPSPAEAGGTQTSNLLARRLLEGFRQRNRA